MKDMMITFHIKGLELPMVLQVTKAATFAKELDRAGKEWRLGNTC